MLNIDFEDGKNISYRTEVYINYISPLLAFGDSEIATRLKDNAMAMIDDSNKAGRFIDSFLDYIANIRRTIAGVVLIKSKYHSVRDTYIYIPRSQDNKIKYINSPNHFNKIVSFVFPNKKSINEYTSIYYWDDDSEDILRKYPLKFMIGSSSYRSLGLSLEITYSPSYKNSKYTWSTVESSIGKKRLKRFFEDFESMTIDKHFFDSALDNNELSNGVFDCILKEYRRRFNISTDEAIALSLLRKVS